MELPEGYDKIFREQIPLINLWKIAIKPDQKGDIQFKELGLNWVDFRKVE